MYYYGLLFSDWLNSVNKFAKLIDNLICTYFNFQRQYWDTGSGFHVTSNTYPLNGPVPGGQGNGQQAVPYTPEVQAARDLHFQLYQQALSSLLPSHG